MYSTDASCYKTRTFVIELDQDFVKSIPEKLSTDETMLAPKLVEGGEKQPLFP